MYMQGISPSAAVGGAENETKVFGYAFKTVKAVLAQCLFPFSYIYDNHFRLREYIRVIAQSYCSFVTTKCNKSFILKNI